MRRLSWSVFAASMAVAACDRGSLDLDWAGTTLPTPRPSWPAVSPSPTAIPIDYGDGRDGSLVVGTGTGAKVNVCVEIGYASGERVQLPATFPAEDGEAVLLLQTQDAFAVLAAPGPITDIANAGRWEIARVSGTPDGSGFDVVAPLSR